MRRTLITGLLLLLGFLLVRPGGMIFGVDDALASDSDSSLQPKLVYPDNAEHCVEPTEIMRRNHMDFLLHQRDETVLNGIRTQKHSLVGCLDCHNPRTTPVVRYENPKHFCAGCHQFASVKIDCFECHSDQGKAQTTSSLNQPFRHNGQTLTLSGIGPSTGRSTAATGFAGQYHVR